MVDLLAGARQSRQVSWMDKEAHIAGHAGLGLALSTKSSVVQVNKLKAGYPASLSGEIAVGDIINVTVMHRLNQACCSQA
eukprot:3574269-Rhodomonas_salina.4